MKISVMLDGSLLNGRLVLVGALTRFPLGRLNTGRKRGTYEEQMIGGPLQRLVLGLMLTLSRAFPPGRVTVLLSCFL